MTSLTTATGITATLIGLLFTFVGASLLSWFKRDTVSSGDQKTIAAYTGGIGAGLVVGLFLGFGCRFAEEMWIRPKLIDAADTPAKNAREEVMKQLTGQMEVLRNQVQAVSPAKAPADKWQELVNTQKKIEEHYAKLVGAVDKPSEKPKGLIADTPRYVFSIQVGSTDAKLAAAASTSTNVRAVNAELRFQVNRRILR